MDINDFVGKNSAGDLVLAFFDWGYRAPKAAQEGTKRRVKREDAARQATAGLYAGAPTLPVSRQVRRHAQRGFEKAMLAKILGHTKRRAERRKLIGLHKAARDARLSARAAA